MKVSSPPGVAWFRQSLPPGALVKHCAWGSPWFSVSSQQQPPSPGTNAHGPSHAISIGAGPLDELLVTPEEDEVAVEPADDVDVLPLAVVVAPPEPGPLFPLEPLEPPPSDVPANGASKS